jgi:pyruvate formate lyase activating enzyme
LYDLKAIDEQVHQRCTTKGNRLILDNLNYLCEKGCRVEIRYPLVTGYNDGECRAIGRSLSALSGIEKINVIK